jgi:8-oxo-dGTP diphosphatase
MAITKFNVRVYGICINDAQQILLSDEKYGKHYFTKFIGGGLEFGEGTKECLIREWKEEMDVDVEIISHFYTTDFFIPSAFDGTQQIISIYYLVKLISKIDLPISSTPFMLNENMDEVQAQRWLPMAELNVDSVSLPIDKIVVGMLMDRILV